MQKTVTFLDSIATLAIHKSLFLVGEIQALLASSQFGLYLAVIGVCMSIMDHYNKPFSKHFETAILAIFNRIKMTSFTILGLISITFILTVAADVYLQSQIMNNLWRTYAQYQTNFILLIACVLLLNKLIFIVYIVDLWQGNKVTAIGLLFTTVGAYYEFKDTPNFDLIVWGVVFFTFVMVFGNLNEMYKKNSRE